MVVLYWLRTPSFIFSTSTVFFNFLVFYYLLFLSVFFYVELGVLLPYLSGCVCLHWHLLSLPVCACDCDCGVAVFAYASFFL